MRKSTIYSILIMVLMLSLPLPAMAQKNGDVNKPTRTRVQEKGQKGNDNKKADNTKDNKKADNKDTKKTDNKNTTQKAETPAAKPAEKKPEATKPAPQQSNVPTNDTTKKAEAPKPKPRNKVNTDNTQFDGIDVSKHQGTINWEELKKNPHIKYVYIKATEGSDYVDPRYKENIRNARKYGLLAWGLAFPEATRAGP